MLAKKIKNEALPVCSKRSLSNKFVVICLFIICRSVKGCTVANRFTFNGFGLMQCRPKRKYEQITSFWTALCQACVGGSFSFRVNSYSRNLDMQDGIRFFDILCEARIIKLKILSVTLSLAKISSKLSGK